MTDERIKEELGNIVSAYMRNPCGEKIDSVLLPYIRAAERLAKIEELEPVLLMMDKLRFFSVADYKDAKDRIETMIAELKEAGE
jgi:hypothetical protein